MHSCSTTSLGLGSEGSGPSCEAVALFLRLLLVNTIIIIITTNNYEYYYYYYYYSLLTPTETPKILRSDDASDTFGEVIG